VAVSGQFLVAADTNAWIWDFSSMHNTIAFSGGAK
jgi:hypothetical protein